MGLNVQDKTATSMKRIAFFIVVREIIFRSCITNKKAVISAKDRNCTIRG